MLATLRLTRSHNAGGNMRKPHGRLHLVDVLTALTATAVSVHPHFARVDLNIAFILQFRHHIHTGKTRVPAFIGIERRNAHQPMHPALGLAEPEGVLALNSECGALDARHFPGCQVLYCHRPAAAFAPALVHAQQHIRPVTAFRTASTCVDGEDTVALVLRILEHGLQLKDIQ